jgi:hypothetical protein
MTNTKKQKFSISILILILGLISVNARASISHDVNVSARVLPSTNNGGVIILINGGKAIIPSSSSASSEYRITPEPEPIISQAPFTNKIIETIEEFLLPRTGGQGRAINFSFLISILGLLICISALRKKKKSIVTHKKHH